MFNRPVTAVPAQRSSAAMVKLKLWVIVGAAASAALFGLLGGFAWLFFAPAVPTAADILPRGAAYAETVARDWLEGRPTPVDAAIDVDTTFGTETFGELEGRTGLPYQTIVAGPVSRDALLTPRGTMHVEVHTFLVSTGDRVLQLDVPLLLTQERPVLAAQPSLQPVKPLQDAYEPLDYRQFATDDRATPEPVLAAVRDWANAFARGDSVALQQLAGDQRVGVVYLGLGGFRVASAPVVVTATPLQSADELLLRVRVLLADDSADGFQSSAEYDLLIHNATSQFPTVVAWGNPGDGPTLQPLTNATTAPQTAQVEAP